LVSYTAVIISKCSYHYSLLYGLLKSRGQKMKLPFLQNKELVLRSEVTMQVNNSFQNNIHWPMSHTNPNNATILWVYYYNCRNDRQWL